MGKFLSARRSCAISALFAYAWTLILVQHEVCAEEPMYYGFFFDAGTAASIKKATDSYLSAANSSVSQLESFLKTISSTADINDPLEYYSKPKDPNTGNDDPLYHVTAKYCGTEKQEECAEYEKAHKALINKTFQMELVGYVLTNRTFGVRIKLMGEQCQLFVNDDGQSPNCSEASSSSSTTSPTMDLPGITIERVEDWVLPITSNKAHATLGCAPGIPAVITGPDMLEVITFENDAVDDNQTSQTWNMTDPLLEDGENNIMMVAEYNFTANVTDRVFVIYPQVKIFAQATFRPYYYQNSGGGGGGSSIFYSSGGGLGLLFMLFVISQIFLN